MWVNFKGPVFDDSATTIYISNRINGSAHPPFVYLQCVVLRFAVEVII